MITEPRDHNFKLYLNTIQPSLKEIKNIFFKNKIHCFDEFIGLLIFISKEPKQLKYEIKNFECLKYMFQIIVREDMKDKDKEDMKINLLNNKEILKKISLYETYRLYKACELLLYNLARKENEVDSANNLKECVSLFSNLIRKYKEAYMKGNKKEIGKILDESYQSKLLFVVMIDFYKSDIFTQTKNSGLFSPSYFPEINSPEDDKRFYDYLS